MRLIDADSLPRHGNRGGLVNWYDIEKAPTLNAWKFVYEELTKLRMFTGIMDSMKMIFWNWKGKKNEQSQVQTRKANLHNQRV